MQQTHYGFNTPTFRKTSAHQAEDARRQIADQNRTFLEIMSGPNPLTKDELAALADKYPARWEKYKNYPTKG